MSSALEPTTKVFEPGTIGWTAADLDDPAIEREWLRGRYEIVEGVLTKMPPAYFTGGAGLFNLLFRTQEHLKVNGPKGAFALECDIIVNQLRVAVADAVFLTLEQKKLQSEAARRERRDEKRTRILIPPMLIIESVSPGHELHDHRTKRRWYAEFGVANYWILDAYEKTLECLVLDGSEYRVDQKGTADADIKPTIFPGLTIPLRDLWGE